MHGALENFRINAHEGFSVQKSADLEKNNEIRYVPGDLESSTIFLS